MEKVILIYATWAVLMWVGWIHSGRIVRNIEKRVEAAKRLKKWKKMIREFNYDFDMDLKSQYELNLEILKSLPKPEKLTPEKIKGLHHLFPESQFPNETALIDALKFTRDEIEKAFGIHPGMIDGGIVKKSSDFHSGEYGKTPIEKIIKNMDDEFQNGPGEETEDEKPK